MAELKVKPLEHMNVRGKKLYYLSISSGVGEPYVINVGEGTYNECMKMLNDAEAQLEMNLRTNEEIEKSIADGNRVIEKLRADGAKGQLPDKDHKG